LKNPYVFTEFNIFFFGETKARPKSIIAREDQIHTELFSPNNKIPQNIPDNVTR
jgi:hypothetical protein